MVTSSIHHSVGMEVAVGESRERSTMRPQKDSAEIRGVVAFTATINRLTIPSTPVF